MAEANNFKSQEAGQAMAETVSGVNPMVETYKLDQSSAPTEIEANTTETTETSTENTDTQTQESQTTDQPAEGTTTEPDTGSQEGQSQEAEQTEPSTEKPETQKEPTPERKFKIGDKELTEQEMIESHESGLRTADYGKKVEELATQRKTFETQSAENLKVVDHANATKDLADLIRNDPEARQDLIDRHGDKAEKALRLAEGYDPAKFVDPRTARIAEQDITIKQQEFLTKADAEVESFTVEGVTISDSDRLAMKDIQYEAADKNGAILNAEQAYWQAKGSGKIGATNPMTVTEVTTNTNGNGKPSTPTSVTNNSGTSMTTNPAKKYAQNPSGDREFMKDLEAGKIDQFGRPL
jgi:hypothetical protein